MSLITETLKKIQEESRKQQSKEPASPSVETRTTPRNLFITTIVICAFCIFGGIAWILFQGEEGSAPHVSSQNIPPQVEPTLATGPIEATFEPRPVALAPEISKVLAIEDQDPAHAFVNSTKISAVRKAGARSKVIINNKIFSLNAAVHAEPKLTVKRIEPNAVVFVDESGTEYRKRF